MKQGATYLLAIKLNVNIEDVSEIIFSLKGSETVQKRYPDDVLYDGGLFSISLTQEDTLSLCHLYSQKVYVEAQINYINLSVAKTSIAELFLQKSLATEIVEGNTPNTNLPAKASLQIIGGVLIATVSQEYIKESVDQYFEENPQLIEEIKESFCDTKKYAGEQAKAAKGSADYAKESMESAKIAQKQSETYASIAQSAANKAGETKDAALQEIQQAKTDSIDDISDAGISAMQSIKTEKTNALADISNSADMHLQSIHSKGQSEIKVISDAGKSEIDGIKLQGETQEKSVNDSGKAQTDAIFAAGTTQTSAVNTAGQNQLSTIQTAYSRVLQDIDKEKQESVQAIQDEGQAQVENIRQSVADYESLAIKETVQGESILIEDSAKWPLKGLKLSGKSTQDGTPSPENPVPIVSMGDGGQITISIMGDETEQSLPYLTPNGLPGIPVSSGGNYTDENGQQWICDEVDFRRGVYVRRVRKVEVSSFRNWEAKESFGAVVLGDSASIDTEGSARRKILSNRFLYDKTQKTTGNGFIYNGMLRLYLNEIAENLEEANQWLSEHSTTVLYMIVPEETPLTPDILTAYAALHTNYHTTTVLNDSGAGMEVEYVADTKNYIKKLLNAPNTAQEELKTLQLRKPEPEQQEN